MNKAHALTDAENVLQVVEPMSIGSTAMGEIWSERSFCRCRLVRRKKGRVFQMY